jgi:propionyl-CoA synthetase
MCYSDIGWIVGHSYIVYAPLFAGATSVMFEGKPVGTPDPGILWRLVEEHKVKTFYIAPTAVRALKKEDHEGAHIHKYDTSSLKSIHLAGEHCD